MNGIAWALILIFGIYIAMKYYNVSVQVSQNTENLYVAPPGVNYYCCIGSPQSEQQIAAFQAQNSCQTTQTGFAPAFGPQENQPQPIFSLEI